MLLLDLEEAALSNNALKMPEKEGVGLISVVVLEKLPKFVVLEVAV